MATQAKKKPALKIKVGAESSVSADTSLTPPHGGWLNPSPIAQGGFPALEVVSNPRTGSNFHVLGSTKEGLRVSMRFQQKGSEKGHTQVWFRLRIGDQNPVGASEYVLVGDVKQWMEATHPADSSAFMAGTALDDKGEAFYSHVSTEGAVDFNREPWDHAGLQQMLYNESFIEELWYVLQRYCTGSMALNRPQFGAWVVSSIIGALAFAKPPEKDPGKMRWKMGTKQARLMTSDKTKMTKKEALSAAGLS